MLDRPVSPEPRWNREPLTWSTYELNGEEFVRLDNNAPVERWPSKECRQLNCHGYCVYTYTPKPYHAVTSHRPIGAMWRCRRCGVARMPPRPSRWAERDRG